MTSLPLGKTLEARALQVQRILDKEPIGSRRYREAKAYQKGMNQVKQEVYDSWQKMDSVQFIYYIANLEVEK